MLEDMACYDEFNSDSVLSEKFTVAMSEMVLAFALLAQQCKEDYLEYARPQIPCGQTKHRKVK